MKVARRHGVRSFPTLVYFEGEIPTVYAGDASDADEVLNWLTERVEGADIETVREDMLERMVAREERMVVLFYEEDAPETEGESTFGRRCYVSI